MPIKRYLTLAIALMTMSGCAYFQFPGVHKVEVQQGNIITQDMVDQLKLGMSKAQVRYVMGTPLIADSFNQDRWDYFYSRQKGSNVDKLETLTLHFENDRLARTVGDYAPGAGNAPE